MLQLPNNCRYSGLKVSPANWQKTTSTKKDWCIHYRFYDDNLQQSKQVKVREGINGFKEADDRRSHISGLMRQVKYYLEKLEYNPISGKRLKKEREPETGTPIDPDTPVIEALQYALEKKDCSHNSKKDLRSVLKYTIPAIRYVGLEDLPVSEMRRKHMKAIFDRLAATKGENWTANNHNFYRAHLSMLFSELLEWEVVELNPLEGIKKKKHIAAKKATPTDEDIEKINTSLKKNNYPFWRLITLFFHSGARITEFIKLRYEDIDLKAQMAGYEVLKGGKRVEQRVIKDVAVSLWQEVISEAKPGQYLFSYGLIPGDKKILVEQIRRRWRQWCQGKGEHLIREEYKLNINATMYSLKHKNSQEVADLLNEEMAARLNAHKQDVLKKHYLTDDAVKNELLKKVGNKLGK